MKNMSQEEIFNKRASCLWSAW